MNALLEKAIQEAYASAPVDVQMLHTLEINHKSFSQPARVACWPVEPEIKKFLLKIEDDAIYNPGQMVEFIGLPFQVVLPEKSSDTPGSIQIRISGVGDYLDEDLEAAALSGGRISVIYRGYIIGREAEGPAESWFGIHLDSPELDSQTGDLTATGTVLDWINLPYGSLYTPSRYPALVRS